MSECDYLLVPSNFVRDSFVSTGFDEHRIHVLPWGVSRKNFSPVDRDEITDQNKKFRVICVGTICIRKGQIYLLEAWKQLKLPNSELLLIGPIEDEMKPLLKKYEGIFTHIHSVPHLQLRHHYVSSDVFVLPSLEDGFAYVCAEAMACGLPVITSYNTGASELLHHGVEGFVVPIRSSESIAEHISRLYKDAEERKSMGDAAQAKIEDYSWEHYAGELQNFYKQVFL